MIKKTLWGGRIPPNPPSLGQDRLKPGVPLSRLLGLKFTMLSYVKLTFVIVLIKLPFAFVSIGIKSLLKFEFGVLEKTLLHLKIRF